MIRNNYYFVINIQLEDFFKFNPYFLIESKNDPNIRLYDFSSQPIFPQSQNPLPGYFTQGAPTLLLTGKPSFPGFHRRKSKVLLKHEKNSCMN